MLKEYTLKEKTAKGLFWGGLSSGVQQLLNFVFGLILARILDANDYGLVGMLAIFSAIASTIQESGFTAALTNQKEICNEDYNAVFWFSSLTGILFYFILFFSAPLIADFYNKPELVGLSRIVFLGFLLGGMSIASNAYLFKTLMIKERAKIDILALVVSGVVGVILVLLVFGYYGLAIQTTTYIVVGSFLKIYYSPWKPKTQLNFHPLKKMFSFSFKLILTNVFTQISNNVFSIILGKFYSPKQLGFYSQGQKWTGMGSQLINGMLNSVAQPVLVQISEDKERQKKAFRKMIRFGAFISFPVMLGFAFIAKEFIWIFLGEKWLPSVSFLQFFCIWGAMVYLWVLYMNLLISHGKSDIYLYGVVFTGVLQLFVVVMMFPFGIYPMVIGYIGVYYIGLLFWHYFISQILSVTIFDIIHDIAPYFCALLLSFVLCFYIVRQVSNIYILLVLKILIVAISYISILWVCKSVILKESLNYLKHIR